MRIGVTGANGQLGSSLKKIAGETPLHTFVFSSSREIDITDKNNLKDWIERNKIELIVNCAAYTAVDQAESEPEKAFHVNVLGAKNLADICIRQNVRLIHISTDYVFNGKSEIPYREDDPVCPPNIYGETKLRGEQAIRESGCDALVIRTSWLYSEFGNNFVKTMLRLGREKDEIRVVDDQAGCPTYAVDLARAVVRLADKGFSGYNIYHYCNDGVTTWYDFARMIFLLTENPVRVVPIETKDYPTPAQRPAYSVLNTEKIRQTGIEIPYWTDSLKNCLEAMAGIKD